VGEFKPKFMATTLESMPHRDVEEACRVMIRNFPEAPNIPHITRSYRIWTEGTPCLVIDKEKRELRFQLSSRENELAEFYDRYLAQDLDYFAISSELDTTLYQLAEMYRENPWPELKLIHFHVPGPYSWGLSLKGEDGAPALYNDTLRDVMIKVLAMKVKWRQRKIKELFPGIETMLCVGDGALQVFTSAGGTGTRDDLKNLYNELIDAVEGITCVHCCSNFDWGLLMETNTDVINFDAYQYGNTMALYSDELKRFLERGGMVAWGITPTAGGGNIEDESPDSLVGMLEGHLQSVVDKGIDKERLLESSWVTPTCEPATMPVELAERVYEYTKEVSQRMRERYFGWETA